MSKRKRDPISEAAAAYDAFTAGAEDAAALDRPADDEEARQVARRAPKPENGRANDKDDAA